MAVLKHTGHCCCPPRKLNQTKPTTAIHVCCEQAWCEQLCLLSHAGNAVMHSMGGGGMAWAVFRLSLQLYSLASLFWAGVLNCKLKVQAELSWGGHIWRQPPKLIPEMDSLSLLYGRGSCQQHSQGALTSCCVLCDLFFGDTVWVEETGSA